MKFDRQRRLDIVMLFFVVLAVAKFVLNIDVVQDILMGDESRYLETGVELPRLGIQDPSWSPLYVGWYYLLSLFEADRVRLYDLSYKLLVIATTALFYLLLRAAKTNLYISALASMWFLLSTVPAAWPYSGLFAVALVLGCLNVIARLSSEENSYLVLGGCVAVVIFVRPEFLVALMFLLGWLALYYWGRRRHFGVLSATKVLCFVVGVVLLFQVFGNPMGEGSKAWPAFGQHFSINYVRWHGLAIVPWFDWREVMRVTFGDATSVWTAAFNNGGAFVSHVAANAGTYTLAAIIAPMIAPLAFLPPRVHGALALLQLGILSGVGLFLVRAFMYDRDFVVGAFPKRLVVAAVLVLLPNVVAALLVYPRWHYLGIQTVLLLAATAALLSRVVDRAVVRTPTIRNALIFGLGLVVLTPNPVWGWLPVRGSADRGLTDPSRRWGHEPRRFGWSFPTSTVFMNYWTGGPLLTPWHDDAVVPTSIVEHRAVIATVRSLQIHSPVAFMTFLGPFRAYLGDNYHDVNHLEKGDTPFSDFLQRQQINMIWVCDRLTRSPLYADDPQFTDFLRDPGGHGFRRIEIPAVDSWLLVAQDLR